MAKNVRKLQIEIERGLKSTEEGMIQLEQLNEKLENANSLQMKEKYESDMKKEIKKLQRLRDFFRQAINSGEIKDKTKLQEAKKSIEAEMEKFREHEKEYKQTKKTKLQMQKIHMNEGKFKFDSQEEDEDYDDEYGSDMDDIPSDLDEFDSNDEGDLDQDKRWLNNFVSCKLKDVIGKYENELDSLRNKKKGVAKKNKDKVNLVTKHLNHSKHIRDRSEELQISIDNLEGGNIRQMQVFCKQFLQCTDDEDLRSQVIAEIEYLLDLSEQKRKDNKESNPSPDSEKNGESESSSKQSKIDSLSAADKKDIIQEFLRVDQLNVGDIMDGQDYLGNWHLAIVTDEDGTKRRVHFLPFNKANRDEEFVEEDRVRLAPAFHHTELPQDLNGAFTTLKTYLNNYRTKVGKPLSAQNHRKPVQEEQKSSAPPTNNVKSGKGDSGKSGAQGHDGRYNNAQEQSNQQSKGKLTKGQLQHQQDPPAASSLASQSHSGKAYQSKEVPPAANDASSKSQPENGKSSTKSSAPITGIQMAPMFQGNPFALKGLRQPQGLGGGLPTATAPSETQTAEKYSPNDTNESAEVDPEPRGRVSPSLRQQNVLDLLDTSFQNMPAPWDQEVIDPKQPMSVWEEHHYPTVPLYSRKENFAKFDLETLFFAFYYQQGTYQQYMAAVELKKKNWMFVKKFETWFKKADGSEPRAQAASQDGAVQKDVGKYVFFDFENGWQQRVSDDIEIDLAQIENELQVQPTSLSGAPISASARVSQ